MTRTPQTWLEELAENGEVRLITQDPETAARAYRARTGMVETFVYWNGDEQNTVVGRVKEERQEGKLLRFTVLPELPGAHAI